MKVKSRKLLRRKHVKHHVEPALVGIGCVLAGVPGMPKLTEFMGHAALEQGRAEETQQHYRSLEVQDDDDGAAEPSPPRIEATDEEDQEDEDESGTEEVSDTRDSNRSQPQPPTLERDRKPSLAANVISRSHSKRLAEAAQTTPSFSRTSAEVRRSEAADDPFGQLDGPLTFVLPSQSTPAVPISKSIRQSGSGNVVDDVLRSYDADSQRHLLQSHYCRSEVRQVLSD